jgi:beta-glucanase (GH16 family)
MKPENRLLRHVKQNRRHQIKKQNRHGFGHAVVPITRYVVFALVGSCFLAMTLAGCSSGSGSSNSSSGSGSGSSANAAPGGSTDGSPSGGCTSGGVAAPCIGGTTTGASGWGSPSFNDEFSSSAVDSSNWNVDGPEPPNNSQEYDCYAPSAVSVGSGYLSIALLDTSCTVKGTQYKYTGGQIDTKNNFSQTYGYYEARIYYPGTDGTVYNWGGFWLVGKHWPKNGEIDIAEGYDGTAGYHFEYSPKGTAIWQGGTASGDYTGWHTYGVDWEPGSVTYYYDGVKMASYTQGASGLDHPMYILLDYSTGPQGDVGGPVSVPQTMKVDYVRVWKAK